MDSRLEEELLKYESISPINNDAQLIAAIKDIIEKESARPDSERDYDLIDEATEALMHFEGQDAEAEESADAAVGRVMDMINEAVAQKRRKERMRASLKRLLPVAAVVVLLAAFGVVAAVGISSRGGNIAPPQADTTDISASDSISEPVSDTLSEPEPNDDEGYANGGTPWCKVHREYYHMYDDVLFEYVGEEAFKKWYESYPLDTDTTDCPYGTNLYRFIHDFDIPREVFAELMNPIEELEFGLDIDLDILYADDESIADEYYRNFEVGLEDIRYKKNNFKALRDWLFLEDPERFKAVYPNYGNDGKRYSLPEMVLALGYTREEMEALAVKAVGPREGVVATTYDYNFDFIFETDRAELEKLMSEHTAYYIDCIFRNVEPTEHPYH